jgi:hypothetical protein
VDSPSWGSLCPALWAEEGKHAVPDDLQQCVSEGGKQSAGERARDQRPQALVDPAAVKGRIFTLHAMHTRALPYVRKSIDAQARMC